MFCNADTPPRRKPKWDDGQWGFPHVKQKGTQDNEVFKLELDTLSKRILKNIC